MDPQTIKLIQRLVAEIAGIGLLIWGLVFIYRGITGKINFVLHGPGFGVKLANASPGVFIAFLGAGMIWFSMKDFSVVTKTVSGEVDTTQVLNQWLDNANQVKSGIYYTRTIDTVIGKEATDRFKVSYQKIHPPETLARIARQQYGNERYWRLVAVANIGKGYFDWPTAQANTAVADNSLLEIWKVSKYYGKTTEEIVKVSSVGKKESYAELMTMAQQRPAYDPLEHIQELTDSYRSKELELVQTPANYSGGVETIGDLSLKYYGDKALWPLIVWTNKKALPNIKSADDKPNKTVIIFILQFIP